MWGGGGFAINLSIIMHFLCGRSRTRLKNASEIWNLDLDLDLAKIWISISSNKNVDLDPAFEFSVLSIFLDSLFLPVRKHPP